MTDFFSIRVPPRFHQIEVLGEDTTSAADDGESIEMDHESEVIDETSTTRRIVRSSSFPKNIHDPHARIKATISTQRRGRNAHVRGDEWLDIETVPHSSMHLGHKVKTELTATQTKRLFLHLARRYQEQDALESVLREVGLHSSDPEVSNLATADAIKRLIASVESEDQASLLMQLLAQTRDNPDLLRRLTELAASNPDVARVAAASINLARYSDGIEDLRRLMTTSNREHDFQLLLHDHSWMFGSEYSERLDRRNWVRDQQADFMMRRTTDGYLELIEIKTPLDGESLFLYDRRHNSWYPRSELSAVLGQVINYLDQIDAKRDSLFANDGERTNKLRARIVIGHLDSNQRQIDALRRFNGHLHRIEIVTFDQLLRTAEQVRSRLVEVLEADELIASNTESTEMDDVPF